MAGYTRLDKSSTNATPSGLNTGGVMTEVILDSTSWTALPASALNDRNAILIQNQSVIEIKLNYNAAAAGYVGTKVSAGGSAFRDIKDAIIIYAKAASGTPTILVEEVA